MTNHISSSAATARENSRSSDGRFGTQPAAEAEIDLDADDHGVSPEAAQAIEQVRKMGEGGSDQIWYFTGGPDERLSTQEIDDVLAGHHDAVLDSIEDTYRDYIYDTQREAAMEACDEADVEFDELSHNDQDAIMVAVDENTDAAGQLYKQLLSNTGSQLVRRRLNDHSEDEFYQRASEAGAVWGHDDKRDVRVRAISEHLAGYGIDFTDPHNHAAVEEIIDNGPYDLTDAVKLELITYNDVEDLAPGDGEKTLTFTDPNILLIDTMNGSGYEAQLKGTLTVPVPAEPQEQAFYTDAGAPGYGWDDVAGVHKPGYRTAVIVAEQPAEELVVV